MINETNIGTILFFFIVGIIIALFTQMLTKKLYGRFLKTLITQSAHDELFSKTLEDVGFEKNIAIRTALRRKTTLSLIVEKTVDENGKERYFIPEERIKKAEALYRSDTFTLATFLVFVACLAAIFFICKYAIPYIFN